MAFEFSSTNLRMVKRDEQIWNITVVKADKITPENLTGGVLNFMAKWSYSDLDANAVISLTTDGVAINITNAAAGMATITVPPDATANLPDREVRLFYDIQYTTASSKPKTVQRGELIVYPGVVRKIS